MFNFDQLDSNLKFKKIQQFDNLLICLYDIPQSNLLECTTYLREQNLAIFHC